MQAKHMLCVLTTTESRANILVPVKCVLSVDSVVGSMFMVTSIVCGGSVFGPRFVIQYFVSSSFAIILMGKRELVALL